MTNNSVVFLLTLYKSVTVGDLKGPQSDFMVFVPHSYTLETSIPHTSTWSILSIAVGSATYR